ncbi:hypothetical protein AMATHDRAFT_55287, partial [Amanita thiersii Skay4041]
MAMSTSPNESNVNSLSAHSPVSSGSPSGGGNGVSGSTTRGVTTAAVAGLQTEAMGSVVGVKSKRTRQLSFLSSDQLQQL